MMQSKWTEPQDGRSPRLRVTGQESLQENSTNEETPDEKIAPLSESVTDDLQVDCSSSNSELVSGKIVRCELRQLCFLQI